MSRVSSIPVSSIPLGLFATGMDGFPFPIPSIPISKGMLGNVWEWKGMDGLKEQSKTIAKTSTRRPLKKCTELDKAKVLQL